MFSHFTVDAMRQQSNLHRKGGKKRTLVLRREDRELKDMRSEAQYPEE